MDLHPELILSSLQQVLCLVVAVKCHSIYHRSENYIFLSFGIFGLILSQFENRVLQKSVRGGGGGRGGQCWAIT